MSERTFLRYLSFQVLGWLAVSGVVWVFWHWWGLPAWIGVLVVAAWVGKDFALYPFLRDSYDRSLRKSASGQLVGARGVVTQDLAPEGWIRVQGTLWQARISSDSERIGVGEHVQVESVEGLCLIVQRAGDVFQTQQLGTGSRHEPGSAR